MMTVRELQAQFAAMERSLVDQKRRRILRVLFAPPFVVARFGKQRMRISFVKSRYKVRAV